MSTVSCKHVGAVRRREYHPSVLTITPSDKLDLGSAFLLVSGLQRSMPNKTHINQVASS